MTQTVAKTRGRRERPEHVQRMLPLFETYGSLLTDRQHELARAHYVDGLSFSEIARREGVKRQAIHCMVRHVDAILDDYESKLGVVSSASRQAGAAQTAPADDMPDRIARLRARIAAAGVIYSSAWIIKELDEIVAATRKSTR